MYAFQNILSIKIQSKNTNILILQKKNTLTPTALH